MSKPNSAGLGADADVPLCPNSWLAEIVFVMEKKTEAALDRVQAPPERQARGLPRFRTITHSCSRSSLRCWKRRRALLFNGWRRS